MQERHGERFVVVGISSRVRNDDLASIGALWDVFRSRDLRAEIGNTASQEIYCVYHEYDDGFADPYRMTIGYRVPDDAELPGNLHRVVIPEQRLVAFEAEGPQPQTLITQWQKIWEGQLKRAYNADYDVYDATRKDLVTVHVGIV